MRVFLSYARVDKTLCERIAALMNSFDVWYDGRILVGDEWWAEIIKQLQRCDCFVYLLSPASVASEYCWTEYEIARKTGKYIFPVLIDQDTMLPDSLRAIHYVDFSHGIMVEPVKELLNGLFYVEELLQQGGGGIDQFGEELEDLNPADWQPPASDSDIDYLVEQAAAAFDAHDYDRAVYLLRQMEVRGDQVAHVNIKIMLEKAEAAVEERSSLRDLENEYLEIAALVMDEDMRPYGVEAFERFQRDYPNYDPDNLAAICAAHDMLRVDWCKVPGGPVTMRREKQVMEYYVPDFAISKYPVTNMQWQAFVDASDGYCNEYWWEYALAAQQWRREHREAFRPDLSQPDHPCVNVSWYEAVAYCCWMSYRLGMNITLPTEQQWQRAAQGDDGRRYPWGYDFDETRCNTKEYGAGLTVPVTWFPAGASPYEVMDMVGNTWEWCINGDGGIDARGPEGHFQQIVKGGSYIRSAAQAQVQRYYVLGPHNYHESIGFRLAWARE